MPRGLKKKLLYEQGKSLLFQNQLKVLREKNKELKEIKEKQEKVTEFDTRAYNNTIIQDYLNNFNDKEADFTNET